MTTPRSKLRQIFLEALEIEDAQQRSAYLEKACGGDANLRQMAEELLASDAEAGGFLGVDHDSLPPSEAGDSPRTEPFNPPDHALDGELPEDHSDQSGQRIGRYKLLQKIGEGGYGTVYMAEQEEPVRRRVALKIIKLGMDTKEVIARFEAERQALALMDHPNIAKVFDAGTVGQGAEVGSQGSEVSDQRSEVGSQRSEVGDQRSEVSGPKSAISGQESDAPLTADRRSLTAGFGRPYFVMELVPGTAITTYCDKNQLKTRERLDLFLQVCGAVQHAHQKGIIHRDLKPSNVLVTLYNGKPIPMVIDFGIAKATGQKLTEKTLFTNYAQMIGTPAYMSPEQAEMSMQDVDTRTDIYSLGVLLYRLLTGSTPFTQKELLSKGYGEMQRIIAEVEPPRPSTRLSSMQAAELTTLALQHGTEAPKLRHQIRGDLDWIVMKCLEKDRTRRYETANGLVMDIERHLHNEPIVARPPSQLYRFQKLVRRNKTAAIAAGSVMLALVLGLGFTMAALVREREARQRELKETVRADTVGTFINTLLWNAVPAMIQQGNVRGARELVDNTDALASSSLSNAPASEINLRFRLRRILSVHFRDYPAGVDQAKMIHRLLPKVSDDQLTVSSEQMRLILLVDSLWAARDRVADQEKVMKEMEDYYGKFMKRPSPDKRLAMICRYEQGLWLIEAGKMVQAEETCAEAYDLLSAAPTAHWWRHRVPALYVRVLVGRGKLARGEQVARESLEVPTAKRPEAWLGYGELVSEMNGALCAQNRFKEATAMLDKQRQLLAAEGVSERQLVRLDALRGEVLARSGNGREALPILETVATNRHSNAFEWRDAAVMAVATGDRETHERLCRIGLLRFTSSAEGNVAEALALGLLYERTDGTTLAIAHAMVERIAQGNDSSIDFIDWTRALQAYREDRHAEALVHLEKFRNTPLGRPKSSRYGKLPAVDAATMFLRSTLCAELGRLEEARKDFIQGRKHLKLVLGDKPSHDRGWAWWITYAAEILQRDAEETFKAKGIPLPKPDYK